MMDPYRGATRWPGPAGIHPTGGTLWQKQSTNLTPAPAKAVRKTKMPLPLDDSRSKNVHAVTLPLFGGKGAAFGDIRQSGDLSNCPVASILSALTVTASGQSILTKLVKETTAATETEFPGLQSSALVTPPPGMRVTSTRYFTVNLPRAAIEVSDVLYTDDADRGWTPIYMHDPNDKSLWGAVIEKALALQLGSYREFDVDAVKRTANDFWETLVGAKPGFMSITNATSLDDIRTRARAAAKISSIAASKEDHAAVAYVTEYHGFAMLGMQGDNIKLYDPMDAKVLLLTPTQFKHDFQAILYQK